MSLLDTRWKFDIEKKKKKKKKQRKKKRNECGSSRIDRRESCTRGAANASVIPRRVLYDWMTRRYCPWSRGRSTVDAEKRLSTNGMAVASIDKHYTQRRHDRTVKNWRIYFHVPRDSRFFVLFPSLWFNTFLFSEIKFETQSRYWFTYFVYFASLVLLWVTSIEVTSYWISTVMRRCIIIARLWIFFEIQSVKHEIITMKCWIWLKPQMVNSWLPLSCEWNIDQPLDTLR